MKLGLLTEAFPTLTLDEIADWASAASRDRSSSCSPGS
jgi:hypothetical protein